MVERAAIDGTVWHSRSPRLLLTDSSRNEKISGVAVPCDGREQSRVSPQVMTFELTSTTQTSRTLGWVASTTIRRVSKPPSTSTDQSARGGQRKAQARVGC